MARICKVLIVEDHDGVRALLGDIFHDAGYRFTLVATGAEMRAALEEDEHEVVVIDVSLRGGEDGFSLAEIAQEQGCGVVLTTGDSRQVERLRDSEWRYILKPFRVNALIELVESVLKETSATCVRRTRGDGSLFPAPAE